MSAASTRRTLAGLALGLALGFGLGAALAIGDAGLLGVSAAVWLAASLRRAEARATPSRDSASEAAADADWRAVARGDDGLRIRAAETDDDGVAATAVGMTEH